MNKIYKNRVIFFNEIVKNFKHIKISDLVVAHRIKNQLFNNLKGSAKKYFLLSKKYSLVNLTPNGRLAPKKELEDAFNEYVLSYYKIIKNLNIQNLLKNFIPPVIRYKEPKINRINTKNTNRSELPHADSWAGWTEDFLLFILPLSGDINNNKIRFYEVPKNINKDWLKKNDYQKVNRTIKNKFKLLKDHYKSGYLYIADITVPHVTVRQPNAKGRLSIDSPLQFKVNNKKKSNKFNMTNYITSKENFLTIHQAKNLKKKYILKCPYKMGEIEKTKGKNAKPAFKVAKK